MGDLSGGNGSMNSQILSQRYWDFNNGDVSCGNIFINSHTLSQCNYSSSFEYMENYVENGDVSGGHGSMKSHILYQHNILKPFMNSNNSDDMEMNADLNNSGVSFVIGSINSQYLYQFNESS